MRLINARNVHEALPLGLQLLDDEGVRRSSRNGEVVMLPYPVTTIYARPQERVLFWPQRDANPALHLYEALWMLAGRDDIEPLTRYAKRFVDYSDDGVTMWGAYGHRWRRRFGRDQLFPIARNLYVNKDDRRCVLQMWDSDLDLDRNGKDVPCNLTATFQRTEVGALDLVVFNRSNDIVWGCYGANAVHFSLLQEYMAACIGCPVGAYYQVSVNWHAYADVYQKLVGLPRPDSFVSQGMRPPNPYADGSVRPTTLDIGSYGSDVPGAMADTNEAIKRLLAMADDQVPYDPRETWAQVFGWTLEAHRFWRRYESPERYVLPLELLRSKIKSLGPYDWLVAMEEWLERRYRSWQRKQEND